MYKRAYFIMIVIAIGFLTNAANASLKPPEIPDDVSGLEQTSSLPLPGGFSLGNYHILFEKTTLSQIKKAIAVQNKIYERGEAGEHIYWLCYTISSKKSQQRLWVISDSEMEGPEHEVSEVTIQKVNGLSPDFSCPELPLIFVPARFDNTPIWIDSTHSEVIFNSPTSHQDGDWLFISSLVWLKGDLETDTCKDQIKGNGISMHILSGRVDILDVGQVTSC